MLGHIHKAWDILSHEARELLIDCSLIEVEGGLDKQYRLHPQAYQFIKSEVLGGAA